MRHCSVNEMVCSLSSHTKSLAEDVQWQWSFLPLAHTQWGMTRLWQDGAWGLAEQEMQSQRNHHTARGCKNHHIRRTTIQHVAVKNCRSRFDTPRARGACAARALAPSSRCGPPVPPPAAGASSHGAGRAAAPGESRANAAPGIPTCFGWRRCPTILLDSCHTWEL